MDAVVKSLLERPQPQPSFSPLARPTREEAEAAVRVLLRWTGDDPAREGLRDTPRRVVKAYEEFFSGYQQDATGVLDRVFEEVHGYDDMVLIRDIPFSIALRASHGALFRHGSCRLLSVRAPRGRAFQAGADRRCLRKTLANAGGVDGADRRRDRPTSAPARLRRHARSPASVHVDAWRS